MFQFTSFLSCICQLHKIEISNILALCGFAKQKFLGWFTKVLGSSCEPYLLFQHSACSTEMSLGQHLCKRLAQDEFYKRLQQVLGFFSHEKIHKISFWKEESVIEADMIVKWIIHSRSSSTSILLGCLSWFPMYEFMFLPITKLLELVAEEKKSASLTDLSPTFSVLPNLKKQKKRNKWVHEQQVIAFFYYFHQKNQCLFSPANYFLAHCLLFEINSHYWSILETKKILQISWKMP